MNKFIILLGFMTGFAGVIVLNKYITAKRAANELQEYEALDAGTYFDDNK